MIDRHAIRHAALHTPPPLGSMGCGPCLQGAAKIQNSHMHFFTPAKKQPQDQTWLFCTRMKLRTCNVLHSAPALAATALFVAFLTGMIVLKQASSKQVGPGDIQLWLSRGAGSLASFYSAVLGPTPACAGKIAVDRLRHCLRHFGKLACFADNALWMYTQDTDVLSTEANQISNEFGAIFSVDTSADTAISFRYVATQH